MIALVLDTDVCPFLFKGDTRAEIYQPTLIGNVGYLSFQTIAELYQWAEERGWGSQRRADLDAWIKRFVTLPHDDETSRVWARIRVERRRQGRPLGAEDAWVAASALRRGLPLVTHNARHFAGVSDLQVISQESD